MGFSLQCSVLDPQIFLSYPNPGIRTQIRIAGGSYLDIFVDL
jgi:hypothetical protein